jgi:hypothetical protein
MVVGSNRFVSKVAFQGRTLGWQPDHAYGSEGDSLATFVCWGVAFVRWGLRDFGRQPPCNMKNMLLS